MRKLEIVQVASGIWSVRRGRDGSSAFLVKLDPGGILIDAGSDHAGADVMQCLQTARVGLRSIRAILLTHAHGHASAGARALRERTGARLLSSREEVEALALASGVASSDAALAPDAHLADGDRVEPFFRVVATPGHSRGHLAFWLEPMRALFTGDAVSVREGAPELSRGTEDVETARGSLATCLALEPALLLPAHGDPLDLSGRRKS
jgi:glyoxylase-like metal-dependent hydrolase (beta-lactamase superfamily II)